MNRRHKACRAPRLQPATPPPPPPLPMPLPPPLTSPPFPTRLRHPAPSPDHPSNSPPIHPPVIAAPNLSGPLLPSDEPYFQRPTPPLCDLWPLEFSSRASPSRNFAPLFLPFSLHAPFLYFASHFPHRSIISPFPSIYLSIRGSSAARLSTTSLNSS